MLYCILFYPPLVIGGYRIYGYQIVRLFAVIYLLGNLDRFAVFFRKFSSEIILMIAIIAYSFFRFVSGGAPDLFLQDLIGAMTLIIVPFFIIDYGRKLKIDSVEQMSKYLIITTTVAMVISMAAFFVPEIHYFIKYRIVQYGSMGFTEGFDQRGFGWGLLMTSSYSFVIAMIIAIGLYYGKNKKWLLIFVPVALFVCLINARTGVLIGLVGLVLFFFGSGRFTYSLIALLVGIIVYSNLNSILGLLTQGNEATNAWIMVGVEESIAYSGGNFSEGTMGTLLEQIFIPNSVGGVLFGEGESLFGRNSFNLHSDIGFVNQLYYGGIIYCIMLYSLVGMICRRLLKNGQKILSIFIIITFFIVNFKGQFVFCTPEMGLTMLVYYTIFIYGSSSQYNKSIAIN